MNANRVAIYDSTLRDGAQAEGVSFSVAGKVRIARRLAAFGIDYIEGGFAASNPKDMEFFKQMQREPLDGARLAAFGSTRRAGRSAAEDAGVQALLEAGTSVTTIFGKSWGLHVRDVLRTTPEENLAMIADTVRLLKEQGRETIYDAEHFYDGYKDDATYALATLRAAAEAGADALVLCDTNGGCLPDDIEGITAAVAQALPGAALGIHAHNDSGCGTANSLAGVRAGARHVQGTVNGIGERCGNADLLPIIANLALKMGYTCLKPESLAQLREVSDFVFELANLRPNTRAPFVGQSAFAHKAGMHVDGVRKNPRSFEHIDPALVGNARRVLVSELSGASNVFLKAVEMGLQFDKSSPEVKEILQTLERLERQGYEFEAAEGSFKLLIQKVLRAHRPFFTLGAFRTIVEKQRPDATCVTEATLKLVVNDQQTHTVGEGDGPVDALNQALRRALIPLYPVLEQVRLVDYQVRILDPEEGTAAKTRVLIESSDGRRNWGTVGVSGNLIEASWEALVDSFEYKLFIEESERAAS
ncbi:MAG: citramalate synthase [Candidatus Marinimicrobia bacterium]|nr:citramalate synthase [Candidatus Neomarinimicrobiota bacterium]